MFSLFLLSEPRQLYPKVKFVFIFSMQVFNNLYIKKNPYSSCGFTSPFLIPGHSQGFVPAGQVVCHYHGARIPNLQHPSISWLLCQGYHPTHIHVLPFSHLLKGGQQSHARAIRQACVMVKTTVRKSVLAIHHVGSGNWAQKTKQA